MWPRCWPSLDAAPTYIERVALGTTQADHEAPRKAIRKALQIQVEGKGYCFVEILSPCPTGWKMDPVHARDWLIEDMTKVFPLGVLRDRSDTHVESENRATPPPPSTLSHLLGLHSDSQVGSPSPGRPPATRTRASRSRASAARASCSWAW